MSKFGQFLWLCGFLLLALIIEIIRVRASIPITLMDLIVIPISIIGSYLILRYELFNKKSLSQYNMFEPITILKRLSILLGGLLLIALGILFLWLGFEEPLVYRSGVRGPLHGYSLIPGGFFAFICGLLCTIKYIFIEFIKPDAS